mmetsp:Transcript_21131/g.49492  ORF Transcript_21131/g.49492 Transcript_21131/m.49492 type:complete len:221 (+) Transcript_21131:2604-3266(+)
MSSCRPDVPLPGLVMEPDSIDHRPPRQRKMLDLPAPLWPVRRRLPPRFSSNCKSFTSSWPVGVCTCTASNLIVSPSSSVVDVAAACFFSKAVTVSRNDVMRRATGAMCRALACRVNRLPFATSISIIRPMLNRTSPTFVSARPLALRRMGSMMKDVIHDLQPYVYARLRTRPNLDRARCRSWAAPATEPNFCRRMLSSSSAPPRAAIASECVCTRPAAWK